MDNLDRLQRQILYYLIGLVLATNLVGILGFWLLLQYTELPDSLAAGLALLVAIATGIAGAVAISRLIIQPTQALWQAILHLSPDEHGIAAPDVDKLRLGRELVAGLTGQIYQLASVVHTETAKAIVRSNDLGGNFIAQNLPLPLIVLDSTETIKFVNSAAAEYIGMSPDDMIGKNVYMAVDMAFPSEETFDAWLKDAKLKNATASSSWERVKLSLNDNHPEKLFDLASYYNRENPDGNETIMVIFDHTKKYSQDDQAVSFMALSVHELRTPLTLLRGYIEVFEKELGPTITDPELQGFMLKMKAMSEQLTGYVNNILNVARVNDDQMVLKLQSEDWATILKRAVESVSLQAKVRGISLQCSIAKDLPPVGVDGLSIREVITNLIDNAIKYSGTSKIIKIESKLNQEGYVETTVQDFGLGIPTSVLPNLFTKFYRDHRNRAQIGGTGLGLYLSKAIVSAHSGTLWVRSREGSGSTFGFTLLPYEELSEEAKLNGDQPITRGAHGWIKNHSLYRR